MDPLENRPLALIVLDGWGIGPESEWNAITRAHTPYYDEICRSFPAARLDAAGEAVGLPHDSPGNAEAGHLNIGTGRITKTDTLRIADSIRSGAFFENSVLVNAFRAALEGGQRVHLVGLLSDGDVHSSPETLFALLRMAKRMGFKEAFVHGILDGRDVPPRTADIYAEAIEIKMADIGIGTIATLCGRFFAMDNSENWERTARAFTMLVHGEGERSLDARTAIRSSFLRGISDEFIAPIVIESEPGKPCATIGEGDMVIFFNHRPDTMRQLVRSVAIPEPGTAGSKPRINVVCLTEYDGSFGLPVAIRSGSETSTFADELSSHGIHTYRFGESERFQHITNFFDGGAVVSRTNERHILIESAKEADREVGPELRTFKITDALLRSLESDPTGIFIANFASPGLIAETGNFQKTIESVQYVDTCIEGILKKLRQVNGTAVITSSHGNCEDMSLADGVPDRQPTKSPVPMHIVGSGHEIHIRKHGSLRDVAPTVLGLLNLRVPYEMTGVSLIAD